jgi:hypothetical protein
MNHKVKRIIAREGLIIIGFGIISFVLTSPFFSYVETKSPSSILQRYGIEEATARTIYLFPKISEPFLILVSAYCIIRFIIWAIKTLKSRG